MLAGPHYTPRTGAHGLRLGRRIGVGRMRARFEFPRASTYLRQSVRVPRPALRPGPRLHSGRLPSRCRDHVPADLAGGAAVLFGLWTNIALGRLVRRRIRSRRSGPVCSAGADASRRSPSASAREAGAALAGPCREALQEFRLIPASDGRMIVGARANQGLVRDRPALKDTRSESPPAILSDRTLANIFG